ncbi:MAG: hypothetical protein HZA58_04500 [Acidimicrobiia bacterium]|nr:hypothetical protein [Acidimicrobiia bacterium]
MEPAAVLAACLMGLLVAFQLALALGAPWGAAAYGGGYPDVLPLGLRINSLVFGLILYPAAMLYVLDAGGVFDTEWLPGSRSVVMWVLVAFFGLGTLANFASRSRLERWWGPVSLALAVCCGLIATSL